MDKGQMSKNKMHRAVSGILESNKEIVLATPGLTEAHIALDRWIDEASIHMQGQSKTGEELTLEKNNTRLELNKVYTKVSRAVVAYATNSTDAKEKLLKKMYSISDSKILKMKDIEMFNASYLLYGDAQAIESKLVPFATVDDIAFLKELADDFNMQIPRTRIQVSKSMTSTKNLEEAISNADAVIKDTIEALVNPYEFMQPTFFRTYKNARIILDAASRKRKPGSDEKQ